MWPTSTASDGGRKALTPVTTKNGTIRHLSKAGGRSYARLDQVAWLFATPKARDYRTGQAARWENKAGRQNLNDQCGGQLNPDWVEWLMGLPTGWTDIDKDVTLPPAPEENEWWPEEPEGIPRIATGIPHRVGRLKGLGNMVVPKQFYPLLQAIRMETNH